MATEPKPRVVLLSQLVGELVADATAAARAREENRPRGPVTGIPSLDEAIGGYLAPGLHILQGGPGDGKTAFSLERAAKCEAAALYISAEMPILELFRRLIARETGTFLGKLKDGTLGATAIERLALQTAERLPRLALVDATLVPAKPETIRALGEGLREKTASEHILTVIDSLQIWARGAATGATEYDLVTAAVTGARNVAESLKAPVLAISHRNRAGQKDGGLFASKGSGDIEYATETVFEIARDKDSRDTAAGDVGVTVSIHKNRHGVAGLSIPLRFTGRLQTFREG